MRFLVGFNKKMLVANTLAEVADWAFARQGISVCGAWLGAVAYAFQIYYDFSGYSDMAIGLGRMLGFTFPENFNRPYLSRSATEFWRRWHMTLGGWFRDYVYLPLGGSRCGRWRLMLNLAAVWTLTGLWHGANWTFVLWGAFYGVLIAAEKLTGLPERIESSRTLGVLSHPLSILAVVCGWVMFRSDSVTSAFAYLGAMFGFGGVSLCDGDFAFWLRESAVFLVAAAAGCLPPPARLRGTWSAGLFAAAQPLLFVVGVSCLVMKSHNPFIYFNF
jgi:D-alanyl-lipoteichoic acid acyltransferase DltB (MBOAT superfamily)